MPEIEIGDAQLAYLEKLRTHIAEEHVGPYGHVRIREVIQFLVDQHEARGEFKRETAREAVRALLAEKPYQELQRLAADTEGVEPGGKAPDLRERLVEVRANELFERLESSNGDLLSQAADREAGGADIERETETDQGTEGAGLDDSARSDTEETPEANSSEGGVSRLQRMMGLLDHYADKWTENDTDEGKYAVTLPDGSVQNVRTKDDVRGLLFKHYD